MLISLEALFGILNVDRVLIQRLENFWIYGNLVYANDRSPEVLLALHQVEPGVLSDVLYFKPFFWISVQNLRNEILCVFRNEFRQLKVGIENLFVEMAGVRVFERQVATDKCKQNHTT